MLKPLHYSFESAGSSTLNRDCQWHMLMLELSSHLLEIPNEMYTLLSQNLIGYSPLNQKY